MQVAKIEVIYLDGSRGEVKNDILDILIATEKITCFRRRDGWVNIFSPEAEVRDYSCPHAYRGVERRAPWPGAQCSTGG